MNKGSGVGVALGDLAAFSVATTDSGRLRGLSDACESGRLCQDKVEVLEGMASEGEARSIASRARSDSILASLLSDREESCLLGALDEPVKRSIASSIPKSR